MIMMQAEKNKTQIRLHGSDDLILYELSGGTIRILQALELNNGNPVAENMTAFILLLLDEKERMEK